MSKLAKARIGSVASRPRLLIGDKVPGEFACKQAGRARRAWFDSGITHVNDWRNAESELQRRQVEDGAVLLMA